MYNSAFSNMNISKWHVCGLELYCTDPPSIIEPRELVNPKQSETTLYQPFFSNLNIESDT